MLLPGSRLDRPWHRHETNAVSGPVASGNLSAPMLRQVHGDSLGSVQLCLLFCFGMVVNLTRCTGA